MSVRLTSLDRIVFPAAGFTKGELVAYYERVAPVLLRHLVDRPLTVARFPEGVDRYGWYQTECRGPAWMRRRRIGTQRYCVVDDVDGLLWLVNAGTVELHPLVSRGERTGEATALVLDLDPGPPAGLRECADAALALRPLLRELGLDGSVKTSGALGLHVYAPLAPRRPFAETKALAREPRGRSRRAPSRARRRPAGARPPARHGARRLGPERGDTLARGAVLRPGR